MPFESSQKNYSQLCASACARTSTDYNTPPVNYTSTPTSQTSSQYPSTAQEVPQPCSSSSVTSVESSYASPLSPLSPSSGQEQFINIYASGFVYNTLVAKFDGQHALEYAKNNDGGLRDVHRTTIATIIINAILEPCPSRVLSIADLTYLSKEILKIFPGEVQEAVYYEKPSPGIHKNGSGTLYAAVQKARKKRKRTCSLGRSASNPPSRSSKLNDSTSATSEDTEVPNTATTITCEPDPDTASNLDFIKNNIAPFETIECLWTQTYPYRIKEIYKPGSVHDYFQLYPVLRTQNGFKLVNIIIYNTSTP